MKRNNEIRSEDNRIKINKFHKDRKKEEKQNVSTYFPEICKTTPEQIYFRH